MKKMLKAAALVGVVLALSAPVAAEELAMVTDVACSSFLPASSYGDYVPWNVMDYDWSTAWVENADGDGIGESITIRLGEGTVITGGWIVDGYCKSEDIFYKNSAPSSLVVKAGGKKCTIDLSAVAGDYNKASAGYEFQFPAPLEADEVTFVINEVRSGNKYQDTCISEIRIYGSTPYEDNSGWDVMEGELPAEVTVDEVYACENMAHSIYRRYTHDEYYDDFSLESIYLDPELRAFLLYWYQYHFGQDQRIRPWQEFHEVSVKDLQDMLAELVGYTEPGDLDIFREGYVTEVDSDCYSMYATGDFGDAGSVIFDNPVATIEGETLVVRGDVCVWNQGRGNYTPMTRYAAYFSKDPVNECGIHTFYVMEIGSGGSEAPEEPGFPINGERTYEELCEMALDHYERHTGYRPSYCDVDSEEAGLILLHLYDVTGDHTATAAWYEVDITGVGTDFIFNTPINLND